MASYRAIALHVDGRKVGDLKDVSVKFMSNGEQIVTLDSVEETDGIITTDGSCGTFVPVGGMKVDLVDLMLKQKRVQLGVPANGKIYKVPAKFTEAELSSTTKTGVVEGKFSFRGGTAKVTG